MDLVDVLAVIAFVAIAFGIERLVGRRLGHAEGIFWPFGPLRRSHRPAWPRGVEEDDDLRWSWGSRPGR